MKIKADWLTWLHAYKEREIVKTFSACPGRCFDRGLELGAGDGFQSALLSKYIRSLVSTEINKLILSRKSDDSVEYTICSAEDAVKNGGENSFDVVYSSNLLEHLAGPVEVLHGINRILKNEGITIHIMPTPFWKLCHVLLHIPINCIAIIEQLARVRGMQNRFNEIRFLFGQILIGLKTGANMMTDRADLESILTGNNPEAVKIRPRFFQRLLMPLPHGVSATNRAEFAAFSRRRWMKTFEEAGFELVAIRKGPAASGYGLGWTWVDRIIEKAGVASELIYIAQKKGYTSRFARYFLL